MKKLHQKAKKLVSEINNWICIKILKKQILKNVISPIKQDQEAEMQKLRELAVIQWKNMKHENAH